MLLNDVQKRGFSGLILISMTVVCLDPRDVFRSTAGNNTRYDLE